MATNRARVESSKKEECTYPIEELIKAHKSLDAPYEIAAVALRLSGKETATVTEAKNIIEKFKKQEVK